MSPHVTRSLLTILGIYVSLAGADTTPPPASGKPGPESVPAPAVAVHPAPKTGVTPATPGSIGLANSGNSTGCFAFFNSKDGCVSADGKNNCRPKISTVVIQQFTASDPGPSGGTAAAAPVAPAAPATPATPATAAAPLAPGAPVAPFASKNASGLPNAGQIRAALSGNDNLKRRQIPSVVSPPAAGPNKNTSTASLPAPGSAAAPAPGPAAPASSASGGICGNYNSETEAAVCLWSGSDPSGVDPKLSGWLSSSSTQNCKKEVIIQRTGSPQTAPVVARLVDGCSFDTTSAQVGCSQIYLSKKAFMALNPSPEEIATQFLKDSITWDFNAKSNPANMPV